MAVTAENQPDSRFNITIDQVPADAPVDLLEGVEHMPPPTLEQVIFLVDPRDTLTYRTTSDQGKNKPPKIVTRSMRVTSVLITENMVFGRPTDGEERKALFPKTHITQIRSPLTHDLHK